MALICKLQIDETQPINRTILSMMLKHPFDGHTRIPASIELHTNGSFVEFHAVSLDGKHETLIAPLEPHQLLQLSAAIDQLLAIADNE